INCAVKLKYDHFENVSLRLILGLLESHRTKGQGVAVNNYKARRTSSDEKLANSTVGEQVSMGSEQLQRRASKNRGDGAKVQVSEQIQWSVSKSKVDGATPVVMEQFL